MASVGVVRSWHATDGWGVLDAEDTPGGCWVHWSAVRVEPPRRLSDGQAVEFRWEHVIDQDGYRFRATAAWPRGDVPVEPPTPVSGSTAAFWSSVTIDGIDADDWPPSDPGGWRRGPTT